MPARPSPQIPQIRQNPKSKKRTINPSKSNSNGPSVSSSTPTGGPTPSTAPKPRQRAPRPDALPGAPTYVYNTLKEGRNYEYYRGKDKNLPALQRLADCPVLGFDLEWRPNWDRTKAPNPVALVQLSSENDIALIQVSTYPTDGLPLLLQQILENPAILKVGVGIYEDAEKAERDMNIRTQNMLDLSIYAQSVDPYWKTYWKAKAEAETAARRARNIAKAEKVAGTGGDGKTPKNLGSINSANSLNPVNSDEADGSNDSDHSDEVTPTTTTENTTKGEKRKEPKLKQFGPQKPPALGLARLAAHYLTLNLPKPKSVSRSNWENNPLKERQLIYAANDAAVALDIYEAIESINKINPEL